MDAGKQARQELDDVTNEMCKPGVVVCDGMPTLVSTKSSLLVTLHTRKSHSRRAQRSRLQGNAGKSIDIVTLSRFWKHASSNARETTQSVAGLCTGLALERWLQDLRFSESTSQPTQPAASRAWKHLCTGTTYRSTQGAVERNAARQRRQTLPWCLPGVRTRVHRAIRHCCANMCRNSEEEVVIPEGAGT